jgi:O-methyltransferase
MRWMKKFLRSLANAAGLDIIKYRSPNEANLNIGEHLGYELENEATECINVVKNHTMLSKRRLVTLYQQVAYCERYEIPGSFVECGVWKGGAMGVMALANLHEGALRRHLHLFDAFQEICEPDAAVDGERALRHVRKLTGKDGHNSGKLEAVSGVYDSFGGPGTLEENRQLLEQSIGYPAEFVHYHVGWFQDTVPAEHHDVGQIAILRLDGDWYASTKVCLEYLFDKVVRGGVVIIDDYGTYEGCRRAVDEFMDLKQIQAYLAPIDSDCRFFVKL